MKELFDEIDVKKDFILKSKNPSLKILKIFDEYEVLKSNFKHHLIIETDYELSNKLTELNKYLSSKIFYHSSESKK